MKDDDSSSFFCSVLKVPGGRFMRKFFGKIGPVHAHERIRNGSVRSSKACKRIEIIIGLHLVLIWLSLKGGMQG